MFVSRSFSACWLNGFRWLCWCAGSAGSAGCAVVLWWLRLVSLPHRIGLADCLSFPMRSLPFRLVCQCLMHGAWTDGRNVQLNEPWHRWPLDCAALAVSLAVGHTIDIFVKL